MGALSKIRSAGFSVSLLDDGLAISPAQNLTNNQRDFLKQHKSEIISELQAERLGKTEQLPKLVKCGNCSNWRGHHQHQRGSGSCAVHVQPLGVCHWFDTPKECENWRMLNGVKSPKS